MEKSNTPELRFPGFKGEWDKSKISTLFKISAGGDIDKAHVSKQKTKKFCYPIYANTAEKEGLYGYADIYKIEPPVLTVAGRGVNIGITHVRHCEFYPIVRLLVLEPNVELVTSFFKFSINNLNIFIESTGVPQLTAPQISTYKIQYPTLPEQQKIASFFTSIDKKIELLKKKHSLLEQYKKGVMQKIFPSTGSGTSPEIRFKDSDGNDYADWEEKKLGEIVEISKGEQLNKENLTDTGYYPCVNGGVLPSGYTNKFNTIENTITISEGGNSCGFVNYFKSKFWCGGHCYKVQHKVDVFNKYLFQLLKYNEQKIMRLRVGSGLPNIQKKDVVNLKLLFAIDKTEQTKIANFLSSIDKKIEKVQLQIDKAEEWKKGLLGRMFC